jgi:hypothetical protein
LQLGQRKTRHYEVRLQLERLGKLLPGLVPLGARRMGPAQVVMRHKIAGHPRHHFLQLGRRLGYVALIQQKCGGQTAGVVIFGVVFQDLSVELSRFAALALPHHHFDHAFPVGVFLLGVLGASFPVLTN